MMNMTDLVSFCMFFCGFWRQVEAFATPLRGLTTATLRLSHFQNFSFRKATSSRPSFANLFMSSSYSLEAIPDRQMVFQGTEAFRQGKISESIAKFDASVPPGAKAYLWQRGISYYYNDEFDKGSRQFRDDVLRSPLDVEEIVWDIACLLRIDNSVFPPPTMMSLPPGKKDRRPIMVSVDKEYYVAFSKIVPI
jgi:hypothetical protein